MIKNPFPGYIVALIDQTQIEGTEFNGDDKFDLPQSGKLIKVSEDDKDKVYNKAGDTYGSLIGKKIYWAKYAEADALFFDRELGEEVVIIALDKLRGYDN
jgi:hypothetical protein